ncbi:hypothetical protein A2U01_0078036, partial [Trifolium medium]|nr:hypothetical protein [Trifolium medium]
TADFADLMLRVDSSILSPEETTGLDLELVRAFEELEKKIDEEKKEKEDCCC